MNAGDHNWQEQEPQQETRIGDLLERRRLEKGLSLKDVEQATKIRARYLEGLEREDYGLLPDAVYVQGFLKTYANFLGLDGERLSREFKNRRMPRRLRELGGHEIPSVTSEFEQPLITPAGLSGAERRRIPRRVILAGALAVLALAAVVTTLYLIGSRSAGGPTQEEAGEPQNGAPAETSPSAGVLTTQPAGGGATTQGTATRGSTTQAATTAQETTAGAFRVTVRVTGSPSGLDVYTDGTSAYSRTVQPGFSQTFEARNAVTVSAANGGAVRVEANGQNSGPLGSNGQPATRTFTRQ